MAEIFMAGVAVHELGWDDHCRLAARAADANRPRVALALVKMFQRTHYPFGELRREEGDR